jgi:RNA polymerase sigma-70 factor (ECF subfamily)
METTSLNANYASTEDAQLLSLVATGNCDALEALYDRYVRACYGVALRTVGDPGLAEEVVQDVFIKVWTAPHSYVPERGKFSTWLLKLVHNRAIDQLRHEKRVMPAGYLDFDASDDDDMGGTAPADTVPDESITPFEAAWRRETSKVVRKALGLLSAPQREVISLAYFGGLSQREVALHLGVPLGTIKTRTQRALLHMRDLLDKIEGFTEAA